MDTHDGSIDHVCVCGFPKHHHSIRKKGLWDRPLEILWRYFSRDYFTEPPFSGERIRSMRCETVRGTMRVPRLARAKLCRPFEGRIERTR